MISKHRLFCSFSQLYSVKNSYIWYKLLWPILSFSGAEVAVLCITRSGEVLNYQAFTNFKGRYTVAETMSESDRWDACLARPISSFHEHCTHLGANSSGVKFSYNHPSGHSHTVRPFVYRPSSMPTYCIWQILNSGNKVVRLEVHNWVLLWKNIVCYMLDLM